MPTTASPALAALKAKIAAQDTDLLITGMMQLGDPQGNSPERIVLMHICDELEKRHHLTETLEALYEDDACPPTYTAAMLIALHSAGLLD